MTVITLALGEIRAGIRNRWVAASILLLAVLALTLSALGSAPAGSVKVSALEVAVASLSSMSVYLVPLIALMLSFDALVGELERGTMLLLLTYPVTRWQVLVGKFAGHVCILTVALLIGYGGAGVATALTSETGWQGWQAYTAMMGSTMLLGAAFIALGYVVSATVRERATAVGLVIGLWLVFVVLYDVGLLGLLLVDDRQTLSPSLFSTLMVVNPTDAYRMFNLMSFDSVSLVSGLAGVADDLDLSPWMLLSVVAMWVVAPLGVAALIFQRREL